MTDLIADLYARNIPLVMAGADGSFSASPPGDGVVALPGSFNPLHRGHTELLAAAAKASGRRGIYEISIQNVDKPDLPVEELMRRLEQFSGVSDVAVTAAPLFAGKAEALPGAWFALGFDTARRLLDDRYYPGDGKPGGEAERALAKLAERGVKFVVAGRADSSGRFREASELHPPERLREMFIYVPSGEFRADISSTELRRARERGPRRS
jgi:hypothetical protein